MSIATRARKSFRLALATMIMTGMMAIAPPASAGCDDGCPGGVDVDIDNDTATGVGGRGGNGGIAANIVALNCFLFLVDCGNAGPLGGADASGGNGAPGFGVNFS